MSEQDTIPQEPEDDQEPPQTFGIFKDQPVGEASAQMTAPVFRAFVDIPSADYADINGNTYTTHNQILERWLDLNQPQDPDGTWWVGLVPDGNKRESGYVYWWMERVKVESTRQVYRF